MRPTALISVTDKTGVVEFSASLVKLGFQIISTGGTAKLLQENGIEVTGVSSYTKSPECFDGRVKSLHPKIAGGILMDRQLEKHTEDARQLEIDPIDLVVCNLYDFYNEAVTKDLDANHAIEHIDIGGPTMLRAAAKNYRYCLPIIDPNDYKQVIAMLESGDIHLETRKRFAAKVFQSVSRYDAMIANFFSDEGQISEEQSPLSQTLNLKLEKSHELRYGENPQQAAAIYYPQGIEQNSGWKGNKLLHGKPLSYNNYLDLDAAMALISEFNMPALAIIKHTNPCGIAASNKDPLDVIYQNALSGDPTSAFGGIIACNRSIDEKTALALSEIFLECIVAPAFDESALEILTRKKNLRLLCAAHLDLGQQKKSELAIKSIDGAFLVQTKDTQVELPSDWTLAGSSKGRPEQLDDLYFAWIVAKHVKSNAIVIAKDKKVLSIGAGQMSRVDSVDIAISKAQKDQKQLNGAVLASDAFFPFSDSIEKAAKVGITSIIQPGGSIRDEEVIQAADQHEIALYLTGSRHFLH
jgi:phosphoribosylaminoimidazolecarboxamide formyltransferase/IMP cyclohydrolase